MTTLISAPENDFLLQEHLVNMHEETMEWLSELEFCNTELAFLIKLLNRAFLNAGTKGKISELSALKIKVKFFSEKTLKQLRHSIVKHEQHLVSLNENTFAQDANVIRKEHEKKKLSVKGFMGSVKKIKREVFDFIEVQMKQSKKISKDFEEGNLTL